MVQTTYANLITLSNNYGLTPGEEYRITDYVTKVKSDYIPTYFDHNSSIECFRSAEHPFDIIVTATSTRNVSPNARAALHSGDTYFSSADLSQWSIYYISGAGSSSMVLDRIPWAPTNEEGGKGAILWMRDDHGNEAFYDFKNIQFLRRKITGLPSIRENATGSSVDFYPKVRAEYNNAGNNKGMAFHMWQGYIEESVLASIVEEFNYRWGDYTLSEDGTRVFCIIDDDSEGNIIAETSTDVWFYTFSGIDSNNNVTDASLDGRANECRINIRQLDMADGEGESNADYDLPESVMILESGQTATRFYVYPDIYTNNTIIGNINSCEIDGNTRSTLFREGWNGAISSAEYNYVICKQSMNASYITEGAYMEILEQQQMVVMKTFTFKSFDGNTYTIDIYGTSDESAIGNVEVEGSAVTIQETNGNDFFNPIRTQTGYIHLTNATAETLLRLIPSKNMQRPFVMKENGTLIWSGFLKPQQFNMQYTVMMYEKASLPIACQLSMVKGEKFVPNTNTQYMSIGRIILLFIATLASNTPEPLKNIVFDYGEQMIGGTQYVAGSDAWLQASISPSMFYDYNEDVVEENMDMQNLVKNLCVFLGLTLRLKGNTLYFLALDDSNRGRKLRKVTYNELLGIVNGTYITGTAVYLTQKSIFGTNDHVNRYAGTDNTLLLEEGVNNAIVECDKVEHSLSFEWDESDVANDFPSTSPTYIAHDAIVDAPINRLGETSVYTKDTKDATFEVDYRHDSWVLMVYDTETSATGNLYPKATIRCYNPCTRTVIGESVYYSYKKGAIKLTSKNSYIYNNCIIAVNFNLNFADEINGQCYARTYVKIGSQYYREVSIPIDNGHVRNNRARYSDDANYDGYGFKIDGSTLTNGKDFVFGKLEVGIIWIRGPHIEGTTHTFPAVEIDGFSIKIIPNERKRQEYEQTYKVKAQGQGDDLTKNTVFIKGDRTSHLDNAISGVDSFVSSTESDTSYSSCEYLAQRMANYYNRARRLYKVTVKRSMVNAKPTDIFTDSPDGAKYTPISIADDYRNDIQKILLAEIDN